MMTTLSTVDIDECADTTQFDCDDGTANLFDSGEAEVQVHSLFVVQCCLTCQNLEEVSYL